MEVINYSFISPKDFDKINLPEDSALRNVIAIKNPLSDEQSVMRTTLVPGLWKLHPGTPTGAIQTLPFLNGARYSYQGKISCPRNR